MFPPTPDYNQQLFAYLHAWRQFLEQWAAMMSGSPFPTAPPGWPMAPFMPAGGQFMPPTGPFMPPMPPFMPSKPSPAAPMPPAPADYTQQLFSYLQAWRQYLEQMTGAGSGPCPPRAPDGPIPPGDAGGNKTVARSDASEGSSPPLPPPLVDIQPESPGGSQIVSTDFGGQATPLVDLPPTSGENVSEFRLPGFDQPSPFGQGLEETQLLNPPDYAFGYRERARPETFPAGSVTHTAEPSRSTSETPAQLPVNSPFSAIMERVEPTASPQLAPRSLFSSPGAQITEAPETPER